MIFRRKWTSLTRDELRRYDHLSPTEAVKRAWTDYEDMTDRHFRLQNRLREEMPVLSRALDRLAGIPLDQ
jgi:hypothetical protein